jgi:hypothetical protein
VELSFCLQAMIHIIDNVLRCENHIRANIAQRHQTPNFRNKSHLTVVRAITPVPITPRIPPKGFLGICSAANAAVRVALISDAARR